MFGRSKSDVDLLQASLNGSTQAFEVLVHRYQSLVCAITYSATGDVGRSEELAQEAFLRAWKSLGQLQDLGKFRAWLCSIARSTVQNWFRSEKREVVSYAAPLDAAAEKVSHESRPEEAVMFEEQQVVVRQALAQLVEEYREPLILFYREGKSTREVALLLGLSEAAARQRISRGRSLLREQVADMVETAIARTRPGKAFTAAVVASIAGLGIRGSATAAAVGGSFKVVSLLSGVTAKVATIAIGTIIIAGGIVGYRQLSKPADSTGRPAAVRSGGAEWPARTVPASERAKTDAAIGPAETIAASTAPNAKAAAIQAARETSSGQRDRPSVVSADAAQPLEFKAQGVLSGRITDVETGEPVRDALVRVSMRHVYTARTDANGFYSVDRIEEAGNHRIAVTSDEYLGVPDGDGDPMVHLSPDQQIVKHFQLPKACMVDVWVVDANGAGIEGATVIGTSLADYRRLEINRSVYSRRTDPNGYILLGGFPPAQTDYLITAWRSERSNFEFHAQYKYAPAMAVLRLTDPNVVKQIQLVLEPGQEVVGYARYEDGTPATDIEIGALPVWWHSLYGLGGTKVRSDGTFTLPHIVPGVYDISVYVPSGDSGYTSRRVMQVRLPPAGEEPLAVRVAGASPLSRVSISGSLICRGEKKPIHVAIEAMSADGRLTRTSVGRKPDGEIEDTFVMDRLTAGTYRLRFYGSDFEEVTLRDVVAPSSGLQVELVYAARAKLTGSVVDARTGEPIGDFRVRVRKLRTLRGPLYVQSNRWIHCTNKHGTFAADSVGPGVYQVQAVAEGYAPVWSGLINTDAPANVVLTLSAGGAISGRVVNEEGEPVDGARIVPLSLAGGAMPATEDMFTNEEGAVETVGGAFTLLHLLPGVETIKVVHPDYASQVVEAIPVAADRTTEGVRAVLTAGGTVEGYVYDAQGKPEAGQVLNVQNSPGYRGAEDEQAGRLGQAVTDANGFYRVAHLPQQLCYVRRVNERQNPGVACRAVVPRQGRTVRIDLGGLPVVRGRVVIDGIPLAQSTLLIGPMRSPHFGSFKCYAVTDEQGAFTFGGAAPGTYTLYYERSAERNSWLPFGTVTVAGADVDAGTLPAATSRLVVTLNDAVAGWQVDSVFLSKGRRLWSAPTGLAAPPAKPGEPYLIRNVAPGAGVLNVRRRDQVYWRKSIDLEPGQSEWACSLDLPPAQASVAGRIRGAASRMFVLWRDSDDVLAVVLPGPQGDYHVEHLPAGRYRIGDVSSALYGLPPIAEFRLGEDEEKTLDLDLSAEQAQPAGLVFVHVVDDGGLWCDGARVRLEGPQGPIEPLHSDDAGQGVGFLTAPGGHTLYAAAPGYRDVVRKVTVKPFDPDAAVPQTVVICLDRR